MHRHFCFHVLAVLNIFATNMDLSLSFCFQLFWVYTASGILDLVILNFLSNCNPGFQSGFKTLPSIHKFQCLHILTRICYFLGCVLGADNHFNECAMVIQFLYTFAWWYWASFYVLTCHHWRNAYAFCTSCPPFQNGSHLVVQAGLKIIFLLLLPLPLPAFCFVLGLQVYTYVCVHARQDSTS